MTQIPQGQRRSEDVELLTNYLQMVRSVQETLRLLTSSAVNMFLTEEQARALEGEDGYDSEAAYELLVYREQTLRQKDHMQRLAKLCNDADVKPIPVNKTILGGGSCV